MEVNRIMMEPFMMWLENVEILQKRCLHDSLISNSLHTEGMSAWILVYACHGENMKGDGLDEMAEMEA